jgi:hypothetical protein
MPVVLATGPVRVLFFLVHVASVFKAVAASFWSTVRDGATTPEGTPLLDNHEERDPRRSRILKPAKGKEEGKKKDKAPTTPAAPKAPGKGDGKGKRKGSKGQGALANRPSPAPSPAPTPAPTAPCGKDSLPCCQAEPQCVLGFLCTQDLWAGSPTCEPCGGSAGVQCCAGDVCEAGLVCKIGECYLCGSGGQYCCDDSVNGGCAGGYVCDSDYCYLCGIEDEYCCATDVNGGCGNDLVCKDNFCYLCGTEDEYCCSTDVNGGCANDLVCLTEYCYPCGGQDEYCCATDDNENDGSPDDGCDIGLVCTPDGSLNYCRTIT